MTVMVNRHRLAGLGPTKASYYTWNFFDKKVLLMGMIPGLMIAAALLPYAAAIAAKAGGKRFDNDDPRPWLAAQQGWRARANAAQANLFEGLPFFYAAVLYALYAGVPTDRLAGLMGAWIALRILYILAYILGRGTVRSLIWGAALIVNAAIVLS